MILNVQHPDTHLYQGFFGGFLVDGFGNFLRNLRTVSDAFCILFAYLSVLDHALIPSKQVFFFFA